MKVYCSRCRCQMLPKAFPAVRAAMKAGRPFVCDWCKFKAGEISEAELFKSELDDPRLLAALQRVNHQLDDALLRMAALNLRCALRSIGQKPHNSPVLRVGPK